MIYITDQSKVTPGKILKLEINQMSSQWKQSDYQTVLVGEESSFISSYILYNQTILVFTSTQALFFDEDLA